MTIFQILTSKIIYHLTLYLYILILSYPFQFFFPIRVFIKIVYKHQLVSYEKKKNTPRNAPSFYVSFALSLHREFSCIILLSWFLNIQPKTLSVFVFNLHPITIHVYISIFFFHLVFSFVFLQFFLPPFNFSDFFQLM